jgi:hypothetical protein
MTPLENKLENKLRTALRETADEIPAQAPPLRLRPRPGSARTRRRWLTWAAPLASAAVVVALVAGSLALTGGGPRPRPSAEPTAGLAAVPPYYVAIVTSQGQPDEYASSGPVAEVRATATGAVLARIVTPRPYADFTGVTAAADDRTFVLSAQKKFQPPTSTQQMIKEYPFGGYTPPARFFLLRINPASPDQQGRVSLRALPESFIPATDTVHDMALSPDGTSLAADVGGVLVNTQLYVFNLATGTRRAWSFTCSHCFPSSGGLGFGGVNVDALSWTADGRHIAFVGPGATSVGASAVRLLDVDAPGSNLLADSTVVLPWPGGNNDSGPDWRGAIITPDGRTIVIIGELSAPRPNGRGFNVREQLATYSAATGHLVKILNNLPVPGNYEQVLYTSATGSALVVSYARPGQSAGIVRGNRYTPIPWNPQILAAAW